MDRFIFINLQPSELMKICIILCLAKYFHRMKLENVNSIYTILTSLIIILLPMGLVIVQPDLGTSLLIAISGIAVLWFAGINHKYFIYTMIGFLISLPFIISFLKPYQKLRVLTFLDPDRDPLGAGYQIIQSKIAVGSGGIFGKGFLKGTQSYLEFLPEKHTDFPMESQADSIFANSQTIELYDQELWQSINNESDRQEEHIELIASENYASQRILEAQGSVLTNKYAEGYPGKRYYGGCEYVDIAEQLAISRAKELFKADYANVQPHSGSSANAAAFLAMLQPNDTILGMSLDHGGHLTHGAKVNFSGKNYTAYQYGLHPETHDIDYDQVRDLAKEHNPQLIIAGFSAFSGIIDWKIFREIADEVGAYFLVDMAHVSGLIAAGLYPSPVPYADVVTSTTHKTLRGPRSGIILAKKNEALEKKLNSAVFPGSQGGPLMHVIAAKAVCFKEALDPEFRVYTQTVMDHAKLMCEVIQSRGIDVVSGKTENHIVLMDLRSKNLTGKDCELALGQANITTNKNAVPNDPQSPFVTSGIRLGTAAVTTRGFGTAEIKTLSNWICDIALDLENTQQINAIKEQVVTMCKRFPVYK